MDNFKKFDDLEPRESGNYFNRAGLTFQNGYGISVINGKGDDEFEIEVEGLDGHISYDTPITDDVIGYLSKDEVTEYMKKIQEL